MYILDVIPLTAIPRNQLQILSYFNDRTLPRGAVVEISLNRRKVFGIVLAAEPLAKRKLIFKKSVSFELKKIDNVISDRPEVSDWQLKIADYISSYYYAPLGLSLKTVLPSFWLKKKYLRVTSSFIDDRFKQNEPIILVQSISQTKAVYEKVINECVKKNRQVFLMVPTVISAKYFFNKFKKYKPIFIHSGIKLKEYKQIWSQVMEKKISLIIGTRIGLFLPFANLGALVVDDESNDTYKSNMAPRYFASDLAKFVANSLGAECYLSSSFPRIDHMRDQQVLGEWFSSRRSAVVNMISEIKSGNFSIFSRKIKEALQNAEKIILYVPRRGFANFIVCQNCGSIVKCPNCNLSLVVHIQRGQNQPYVSGVMPHAILMCHHCRYNQPLPKQCSSCGSYKMRAHGLGIEKVVEELKKYYARMNLEIPPILKLDIDSNLSESEEEKLVSDFNSIGRGILVATPMLLSHKYLLSAKKIGIISADSLIYIPDFRAEEWLFRQIWTLRQISAELIIQTYNLDDAAIKLASAGKAQQFIFDELVARKNLRYPPFSQLVKLSYKHLDNAQARKDAIGVYEKLKYAISLELPDANKIIEVIGPAPAFIHKEKGYYYWIILIKSNLEIKKRNELLRLVPPNWIIDVDPRSSI